MNPRLDALPPPQRRLWPELRATPHHFVLYGGTAIALRLAHRESEDFDFFSSEPLDGDILLAEIPYIDALMRLGGVPLEAMLGAAAAIHGELYNAMLTLKALAYFGDGDLAELPAAVRKRLSHAAAKVDPGSIPHYEPLLGIGPPSPGH